MGEFTWEEKAKCAERELAYRQRVYPRLVAEGKMTPSLAQRQLDVMQEIADDLAKVARGELLL